MKSEARRWRHWRGIILVLGLTAMAACGTEDEGSADGDGETTDSGEAEASDGGAGLEPLDSGFPDSPITLINIDEAGSDDGIYARQVAEIASGLSPVAINVEDRPDFGQYGTWEGLRWMERQDGGDEGYLAGVVTVPGATGDLLSTPVADDLDVTMDDLNFVLATESLPYVVVSRPDMPWGESFPDMMQYAADNPGEVRYLSRDPGSGPNIALQQYVQLSGAEFDTSIGGSHQEILTALSSGAADVAVTLPGQVGPFLEDERIVLLGCTGRNDPCAGPWDRDDVPNLAAGFDEIDADPWGSTRALFVPPGVPEENRQWLEDLLREVAATEEFADLRQEAAGTEIEIWSHDELDELQKDALAETEPILEEAGLLYGE